ncbi:MULTISPECIES: RbsD/FucU family protein [unclassified Corynebacterium]|uniref:RbsD/FucU family protein n=1 Tax=unclassified Corynebacterium TaxID=2624378 RepID=UPI001C47CCAE|nr:MULTISPECIES: RbsD/FucU domain-containing protein [unclassified Corynebacterium]MBV7281279.1 fucose isomerase [Corynebacterium sp. TAE3-ERU30]MBV7301849.1 fucose isomerase [Corynebacterium sp. TAE3-ERU2]
MLRNIPEKISPELLYTLARMGHGDRIVIGDGNFPGYTLNSTVIHADGHTVAGMMDAILKLMPLDPYNPWQIGLMETVGDDPEPPVWSEFAEIAERSYPGHTVKHFERFEFYEQVKKCFAVVATTDTALYGNIILTKGIVIPE